MVIPYPTGDNYNSRPTALRPPTEPKDILIFLDGTGKDGGNQRPTTNIWQLYKIAESTARGRPKRERICYYVPGIGSDKNELKIKRWLVQVYGSKIVDQVLQAWNHIFMSYRLGDHIYLFGYSRGAFAARKVASLLHRLDLFKSGRDFLKQWRLCERPLPWVPSQLSSNTSVPVECIGVWDTVGAVYSPVFHLKQNLIGTPDDELPPNVKHAFHALAFHENRKLFRVNLFENPVGRTKPKQDLIRT
ncbi:putative protein YEL023C OS=Saccharomyces cerevisiae (strain ATCC 204508 / S288c) GN=YEL023C PE=4 SV=1 [Rhizoctonia solani AG-1 IB]|uniref:T6SS Phospholipase effector Tle1-like catalytic domain-containing protein n=1 Tax=Thanatephorus cucumeris (strain AG1-IB / isolate 7/3/14) TaxID=1108050 RepID=A0A0B7FY12_THACB|nr:putative protein YEL023C OS=Saccharomyces cerevisiae (strain ATCC 204508 / S288c) GN=YEL023C PE=4 SV=1 [Rhizoctonia solani AG-1 IB]